MNYLPTCTSRLVAQHPYQVSFKSMQDVGGVESVKILSVKDNNSAKICRKWIISPYALLDLWPNIPTKFHSNPSKDVGGVDSVEKTNGMTDKANTKCPLAILWRGHKKGSSNSTTRSTGPIFDSRGVCLLSFMRIYMWDMCKGVQADTCNVIPFYLTHTL